MNDESIGSNPTKMIERVCIIFSCVERKLMILGGQKTTKACLNLELIAKMEMSSGKGSRQKRNSSSEDFEVRESFKSLRKSIEAEKGG